MKRYDKLIRDKIPEVIAADGKSCKTRVLHDDEYRQHLKTKLQEEVDEFTKTPCIEEIADILEVLEYLAKCLGADMGDVEAIKRVKKEERGGFEKRLFLEYVE